jgi:hypothetical protein
MARPRPGYTPITIYLPDKEAQELKHFAVDERAGLGAILAEAILKWWSTHPARGRYRKGEP